LDGSYWIVIEWMEVIEEDIEWIKNIVE